MPANPFVRGYTNQADKKSSAERSADRQARERALRDSDYKARLDGGSSAEQSAGRQQAERAALDKQYDSRIFGGELFSSSAISSAEQALARAARDADYNKRIFGGDIPKTEEAFDRYDLSKKISLSGGYSGAVPDIFSVKPTTVGYTGAVPTVYSTPRERALQTLDDMSAIAPLSPRDQALKTLDEMGSFQGEPPVVPDLQAPDLVQRIPAEAPIKGGYTPEERARVTASNMEAEQQKLVSDFGSRTSAREQIKSLESQGVSREEIMKAIGTGTSDQQTVKNLARLQRDKVDERSGGNRGRMVTRLEKRAERNKSSAVALDVMTKMDSPSADPSSDKKVSDYLTKSQQKRLENYYNSASHKKPSESDQKNAERLVKLANDNMNKEMAAGEFERKEEVRKSNMTKLQGTSTAKGNLYIREQTTKINAIEAKMDNLKKRSPEYKELEKQRDTIYDELIEGIPVEQEYDLDVHKSANDKAKKTGEGFYIVEGNKFRVK